MKKLLSLLLTFCLLLGVLPMQALAYVGDIRPANSQSVQQNTLSSGSLELRNDYLRVIVRKDGTLSTAPAADSADPADRQTPLCEFITWKGYGYDKQELVYPADIRLKNASFVDKTPNGDAKAIKVEYDLTAKLPNSTLTATTAVYYELVQRKENESSADAWSVLTTVSSIYIIGGYVPLTTDSDAYVPRWGYTLDGFTGMGHANATDGPAIKMSRTVYNTDKNTKSTESSVITSKVEDLSTWDAFFQEGDYCGLDIGEVYVDGYTWANPFVGLKQAYKTAGIDVILPETVSVTPSSDPAATRVECKGDAGYHFNSDEPGGNVHFLWGFRDLRTGKESDPVPTMPDAVDPTIYAKRLAAFAVNGGVTVEYVADDAALETLKKKYGAPVALINGDYESTNGASFEFTGGAAMLSSSVTATWDQASGGKLVIHKDGHVEHSGVSLNAPSFKFYQPNSESGEELEISLTKDGFVFDIDPDKNDAIIFVDIPYATVKLEQATADAAGNLVFAGAIGFQTVFEGASFTLEELGYGLNEKNEFTVNGVHATGSFDTAKTLSLELAEVEGEVNTFKGKEKYAFKLELNAFDLFETEAELELVRSKTDGSLLPNTLYFYVAASPGIPLIPPVPVGQLNGGGAGFSNLADTVNGDYFAIPPLKLRGTLKGTYLHLIEGKGDVVIGPSEISLTASEVGIVGTNASIIDSFGYSLKLNGQERTYNGTTYRGIYLAGSEALELNLPSTEIDVFILNTSIKLGAFGGTGTKNGTKHLYLGVGANAVVKSKVQVPSDVPVIGGWKLGSWDVDLIVGGQTEFPIKNASVSEGMKQAFSNIDLYLGAMTGVYAGIIDARLWVLVPNIVETNFHRGGGWDVETKWFGKLPEWDWSQKGVEPVVQSMPAEDGEENIAVLFAAEPLALENSETWTAFEVNAGKDETPYILLAFDNTVTEKQIKDNLSVKKQNSDDILAIHWLTYTAEESESEKGIIDEAKDINAATDIIKNNDGKDYRVAILRLSEAGTYEVNTGALELATDKSESISIAPFESLELRLSGNRVSGEIKYAEENTKYVLRTYLAKEEGGADYLIDEQTVEDPESIAVSIPTTGALVPTGEYYVTSFLMTEKSVESTNESGETETLTGLVAIDNNQFVDKVSYTNTNQPSAPTNVMLEATGNEVMHAAWGEVDGADGYRVTIYQQDGNDWIDTGFGYDLDENTTSIDMALTVGGEGTEKSPNLSAGETYRVGVSAYKTVEGGKYYSTEAESVGEYLPEYTPLEINLAVNGVDCTKDENGVFYAYVGGEQTPMLQVSCTTEGVTYRVTRMDLDTGNEITTGENEGYPIPEFTGTLMLRVDGLQDKDKTSVFLLVSRDETAPMLTLSDPVFFADKATGEYTVTGTADAGSKIVYGSGEQSVYAAGDGSFAISGTLEGEKNSGVLSLYAQDSAGNQSAPQVALIAKQARHSVTVKGSYAKVSGEGIYAANSTVTISAGARSGYTFSGWTSDSGVTFADASAEETTFTMPDNDVTVTANWTRSSSGSSGSSAKPTYPVSVSDKMENGTVTVSPKNAAKGDTVTITVKPDEGYALDKITVTDKDGNELPLTDKGDGRYTFTMPSGKVEIGAAFAPEIEVSPFADVAIDAYYYQAVKWAVGKGITTGVGEDLFAPDGTCSRAQIVTFLWRAAGSPESKTQSSFADVPADSYYAKAVAWAVENGVTTGTGEGRFSPDDPCSRSQAVTLLWRAMGQPAGGSAAFTDVPADSYFARAVAWAAESNVTTGVGEDLFAPDGTCSRAQIVTFLWRAYAGRETGGSELH